MRALFVSISLSSTPVLRSLLHLFYGCTGIHPFGVYLENLLREWIMMAIVRADMLLDRELTMHVQRAGRTHTNIERMCKQMYVWASIGTFDRA